VGGVQPMVVIVQIGPIMPLGAPAPT
jgi:hypothetical protein